MSSLLALSAAALWGSGGFLGGAASRKSGAIRVVFLTFFVQLVIALGMAAIARPVLHAQALAWGGTAGLVEVVGFLSVYRAFSAGRMGVVAATSWVVAGCVPVVFDLVGGTTLSVASWTGVVCAIVAVILVSLRPEEISADLNETSTRNRESKGKTALLFALFSGLCFGCQFIFFAQIRSDSVIWGLLAMRVVSIAGAGTVWAASGARSGERAKVSYLAVITSAALFVAGDVMFIIATHSGSLALVTAVATLGPAFTAILARLFLNEYLLTRQRIGIAIAIGGVALISVK